MALKSKYKRTIETQSQHNAESSSTISELILYIYPLGLRPLESFSLALHQYHRSLIPIIIGFAVGFLKRISLENSASFNSCRIVNNSKER